MDGRVKPGHKLFGPIGLLALRLIRKPLRTFPADGFVLRIG